MVLRLIDTLGPLAVGGPYHTEGRAMSNISDEVRKVADEYDVLPLYKLSDRIDRELVELPKDADGVPIHVGDTVYTADGSEAYVARIDFVPDVHGVELRFPCGTISEYVPRYIYHTRTDSWESIAQGLEDWAEDNGFNGNNDVSSFALDFADRIRKLAAREGGC